MTTISSGATSSGLYVRDGDTLRVLSGGVATDIIVLGGGELSPAPGGIIENVDVRSRGYLVGGGKLAGSNTVEGSVADVTLFGTLSVGFAGRSKDVAVASGGVEVIGVGAVMTGGVVASGGELDLFGRHLGSGEILSGGTLVLSGKGSGLEVQSGGTLDLGTIPQGTTLVYKGATIQTTSHVDGVSLAPGARLDLGHTTVAVSGVLSLTAGAPIVGSAIVDSGGALVGPGLVDSAFVSSGGSVSGVTVVGTLIVIGGGSAGGDTIGKGALELAEATSGETVLRFGELEVFFGSAIGTVVKGGTISVGQQGIAGATVLSSGGRELVGFEGRDVGTTILSGAVEEIVGGFPTSVTGFATGSLISSGGLEVVSGGATSKATVFGGGTLSVTRSGSVLGGLTLAGGTAIISGTASAGQTVGFGASGTLELGNLAAFHASISGLSTSAQKVDLDGFAFTTSESVGWTQSGTSGTLTVTDGAKVATLTLIGSYATSDFKLAADGHGGTFVFDPRPAPAVARLAQAAAGLHGGRFGADIAVANGGGVVRETQPLAAAISGR